MSQQAPEFLHEITILEQLLSLGLIPLEEYQFRKAQIINRITKTMYNPSGGVSTEASPQSRHRSAESNNVTSQPVGANTAFGPTLSLPFIAPLPMDPSQKLQQHDSKRDSPTSTPAVHNQDTKLFFASPAAPMLPSIDFLTKISHMEILPDKYRVVAPAPAAPLLAAPFAPAVSVIPMPVPPTNIPANLPTFLAPMATIGAPASAFRGNFSQPPFRPIHDQRYSESSSLSSEDESSESDARKLRYKRSLDHISGFSAQVPQDPILEDPSISTSRKRQKTSDGAAEESALAGLAAVASSESHSQQHKTLIHKLQSELVESHSAIHDAHAALHEFVLRDEERRRVSVPPVGASQTLPGFPQQHQQQGIWSQGNFGAFPMANFGLDPPPAHLGGLAPLVGLTQQQQQTNPSLPKSPVQSRSPSPSSSLPEFRLEIVAQPPTKVVYQRILKPFPQVAVSLVSGDASSVPTSLWNNLYVEATLLRSDTYEPITHVDGSTMVRVWNGVATFRKLKIMSTTQQIGSLIIVRFSLKLFEGNEFRMLDCEAVGSTSIEVFSHSQYLKGSNARDKQNEKDLKAALQLNVTEEQSQAQADSLSQRNSNSDDTATTSTSSSTRQGSPSDSPPNELEEAVQAVSETSLSVSNHIPTKGSHTSSASEKCSSEVAKEEPEAVNQESLPSITVEAD